MAVHFSLSHPEMPDTIRANRPHSELSRNKRKYFLEKELRLIISVKLMTFLPLQGAEGHRHLSHNRQIDRMNAQLYQYKFMDSLGARLRRKRREKGWTQEQLAIKAGTNQAVIQKIENGKSLRPRKINEIADVLEVNPAWLMFGDRSANLTDDAVKVAEAWEDVPEPARSRIKEEILRMSKG